MVPVLADATDAATSALSTKSNKSRYIFISYAKGCINEINVHVLAASLKQKGYNMYCDEGTVDLKLEVLLRLSVV